MKLDVLEKFDPASGKSEFECHLEWLRGLLINMQEKGVGDRFGDDMEYHLPTEIQWLTNLIEVSKREREFLKTTKKSDVENWSQADRRVWKLICDLVQLICHPNDNCYPNVKTVTHEFREIFKEENEGVIVDPIDDSWFQEDSPYYLALHKDDIEYLIPKTRKEKYALPPGYPCEYRIVVLAPLPEQVVNEILSLPPTHRVFGCCCGQDGYAVLKTKHTHTTLCCFQGHPILYKSLKDVKKDVGKYWASIEHTE